MFLVSEAARLTWFTIASVAKMGIFLVLQEQPSLLFMLFSEEILLEAAWSHLTGYLQVSLWCFTSLLLPEGDQRRRNKEPVWLILYY